MILVSGGTGFIGREIVKKLDQSGSPVRVITRSPANAERLFGTTGVEIFEGNVLNEASLERAMSGARTVVSCLQHDGYPMEKPGKGLTFLKVDGAGTVKQVNAAKRSGVEAMVYVSGAGAGEGRGENWFRAKDIAEKAVRESGLGYTIFRPTWVFGPGDRSVNRFVRFARALPFVPMIGDGSQKVQPLYVGDLAEIIAAAASGRGPGDLVLEAGGPQVFTMRELLEKVLQVLGSRKPIVAQPVSLIKVIAGLLQHIPGSTLSPGVIDFAAQEAVVDNRPLLELFPISLTRFEDGLKRYV